MRTYLKKWIFVICMALLTITCVHISYDQTAHALEATNRTEIYAPNEYNVSANSTVGYAKIYENNNFEYFYSSQKTILKILNKKSGFVWSTGADTDTYVNMQKRCSGITKYSSEYYACAIDAGPQKDGKDSATTYAEINGLLAFSLLSGTAQRLIAKRLGTIWALSPNTTAALYGHAQYANEWMFKLSYVETTKLQSSTPATSASAATSDSAATSQNTSESAAVEEETKNLSLELYINMRLTFTEDGLDVHIYEDDISGISKDALEAIYPLPLLGQSGGKMIQCRIDNPDENGKGDCSFTSELIDNPKTNLDGYIFIPDGSGALIRFDNVKYYGNNASIYFDVYKDPYRSSIDANEFAVSDAVLQPDYIETKHISMPVWGVAYGNNQDAFVAYATSGSEYFGLLFKGRSDVKEYTSIMPRFEKNRLYNYAFGDGKSVAYMISPKQRPKYDIGLSYIFLQGDGHEDGYGANYIGMALKYRDYIQRNHLVKENVEIKTGPKIDFLMSDAKEGIFSMTDVNVTTTDDVINILNDFHDAGIENITSSIYGWQKGGISTGKPWKSKFNGAIGGKSGFKKVVKEANEFGYDINFYTEYSKINQYQTITFNSYAVKTLSRQYGMQWLSDINKPIWEWYYTNVDEAGKWLNKHAKQFDKFGDNTGIQTGSLSTLLVPDYGKDLSYASAANSIYQSTKEAASKVKLSGDTPNAFLWRNYDNFTNISVYNSQYHCETDSVPFMEIVLGGLVNMYAEYSNFSFYDDISQLKMIEYNLNPSFIVSAAENTNIMYTNARDWFSTVYSSYQKTITEMCDYVLPYLKLISGKTMVDREVVEYESGEIGVYINTYASFENGTIGNDKVVLAINYSDSDQTVEYNGKKYTISRHDVQELR